MKHYMSIENLRETEEHIGDIIRTSNTSAFSVGDIIQITEKYDGSNASIENIEGTIQCFSRNKELDFNKTLNGFYNYIQQKIAYGLDIPKGIVVFGEWSGAKNRIIYEKKNMWLVFDIYDRQTDMYMSQEYVKRFCKEHNLDYINELYYGPFISWDHCRTFCHIPSYGDRQEGVVIKNQNKLIASEDYYYLKIVNADFKERIQKTPKQTDSERKEMQAMAMSLMESIVTKNRVEKILFKLRDEGIIGSELTPKDMETVAKNLPARIYNDCLKEEPETVIAAGEYAGRLCNSISMRIAKDIILER